ncbi:MAG: ABC transporter permease [Kiritimatiellae bacterium]|nr:ABC transporter permease [Kiritimatiellia bacterium]
MSASARRVWLAAMAEWRGAIRSRRALVLLVLYLASAVLCMYGTISILGKMETELASILQLPDGGQTGVVSETLWKSEPFRRLVRAVVRDSLVFEDLLSHHPVDLLYAWFAFLFAPMLVVLVSGGRVAEDRSSGAVRYMLMRVTRLEWSAGKYAGQAMLIACAIAASALGAWCVVLCRLPSASAVRLFEPLLVWGAKAWVYSLSWLGLSLGISHLTRTSGKAVALGILCVGLLSAAPGFLGFLVGHLGWPQALLHLEAVMPGGAEHALWRSSPVALAAAAFHLVTLGLVYLMAGAAVFAGRDA